MKELISIDELGILVNTDLDAMADSRYVADVFGKDHNDVLRSIQALIEKSGFTDEFVKSSFVPNSPYKKQPYYMMTRDGFIALVMGFKGRKAHQIKKEYIKRFNETDADIRWMQCLREQHPYLTEAIHDMHDDVESHHYTNEADMLYDIVIEMTAAEFRKKKKIEKTELIKSYMEKEDAELLDYLQIVDIGLVYSIPNYQERKQKLEWCAMVWRNNLEMYKAETGVEADAEDEAEDEAENYLE